MYPRRPKSGASMHRSIPQVSQYEASNGTPVCAEAFRFCAQSQAESAQNHQPSIGERIPRRTLKKASPHVGVDFGGVLVVTVVCLRCILRVPARTERLLGVRPAELEGRFAWPGTQGKHGKAALGSFGKHRGSTRRTPLCVPNSPFLPPLEPL